MGISCISAGLLTKDIRKRERKKIGQPGARAKWTWYDSFFWKKDTCFIALSVSGSGAEEHTMILRLARFLRVFNGMFVMCVINRRLCSMDLLPSLNLRSNCDKVIFRRAQVSRRSSLIVCQVPCAKILFFPRRCARGHLCPTHAL